MSWISTILQNLLGYLFVLGGGVFKLSTAKTPARILMQNTSKDAVPRKDVPFGDRQPKVKLYTPFCPMTTILGLVFDGTSKFLLENAYNIGQVLYKRPIIVAL